MIENGTLVSPFALEVLDPSHDRLRRVRRAHEADVEVARGGEVDERERRHVDVRRHLAEPGDGGVDSSPIH
jgi:hypothetical protein